MRCTVCSREVRPVVAVDIDGTLADYHQHLLEFADKYLYTYAWEDPVSRPLYDGSEPFRDWFCRHYDVDVRTFRDIKLAYRSGAQKRTAPAFEGVTELVARLRTVAEVYITTTRPYMRLDNIDPDTRFWLDKHQVEFDGLLYDEKKYRTLARIVDSERVVAVLEDQPDQYDMAAEVFGAGVPILRKTYWNRGVERPQWAANLINAREFMVAKAVCWQEQRVSHVAS